MGFEALRIARDKFEITESMSGEQVELAIGDLANTIQQVADEYSAQITTGDTSDEAQRRADLIEDVVAELQNITTADQSFAEVSAEVEAALSELPTTA